MEVSPKGISCAHVAQLVEHILGKDEVSGSIPLVGSSNTDIHRFFADGHR